MARPLLPLGRRQGTLPWPDVFIYPLPKEKAIYSKMMTQRLEVLLVGASIPQLDLAQLYQEGLRITIAPDVETAIERAQSIDFDLALRDRALETEDDLRLARILELTQSEDLLTRRANLQDADILSQLLSAGSRVIHARRRPALSFVSTCG